MNPNSKTFKGFRVWMRQTATWVTHGFKSTLPYVILMGILFGIAYIDSPITNCKERDIRWIGLFFQIFGFMIVVHQLDTRRRLFRMPSFLSRIGSFWKSFPSPYVRTVNISAHAIGGLAGTLSARLSIKPGPNTSLEKRMQFLENEIQDIRNHVQDTVRTFGDHKAETKRSLEKMREEMRLGDDKLQQLINDAVVGGIKLEWVGILYFLTGVFLSTASSDIAVYLDFVAQCNP